MLLEESDGYKMGPPDKKKDKTHTQPIYRWLENISAKSPKAENGKWDLSTSKYEYWSNM